MARTPACFSFNPQSAGGRRGTGALKHDEGSAVTVVRRGWCSEVGAATAVRDNDVNVRDGTSGREGGLHLLHYHSLT